MLHLSIRPVLVAAVLAAALSTPALAQRAVASPRDTTVAAFGGDTVLVDYGRPYKRGREIFGGLVPFDRIWRTGANAATTLVTDVPLTFGSTKIPAGTYTLYTVPGERAWQLLINRQTGQWGTDYDESQELARVPMTVRGLPVPVEQFTIAIAREPGGGTLKLQWDTTEAAVPFTIR